MSSFPVGDGEAGGNTPREMVGAPTRWQLRSAPWACRTRSSPPVTSGPVVASDQIAHRSNQLVYAHALVTPGVTAGRQRNRSI